MSWRIAFVERLKYLLLEDPWQIVSIYKQKDKVLVYVDGGLEIEFPIPQEEQVQEEQTQEGATE